MESPLIGSVQGKVWGTTQLAFFLNGVSAHRIHVWKGGYCSKHSHEHRWNRFLVLEGDLLVKVWKDGIMDETIIGPSDITDVPPGVRHQFEATTEVDAIEFYWTTCNEDDIDRHGTVGGVRQ